MNASRSAQDSRSAKTISKYLQSYSESEAHSIPKLNQQFQYSLIIPAFDEHPQFLQQLIQQFSHESLLIILVINRPDNQGREANAQLYSWIEKTLEPIANHENQSLFKISIKTALLVVDRNTKPIPKQEGVGLARKIAADCATMLIQQGIIESPWIASTDADTKLPDEYFQTFSELSLSEASHTTSSAKQNVSVVCFPFQHKQHIDSFSNENLAHTEKNQAGSIQHFTQLYEIKLHHYVLALRWSGSPYAFHTIGSCLAFNYLHYAQARGFPKKSAGEDFYLLNKLAKLGKVHLPNQPILSIQSRLSDRVPFGTGPAVQALHNSGQHSNNGMDENLFYNPDLFNIIKSINNEARLQLGLATKNEQNFVELNEKQKAALQELKVHLNIAPQLDKFRQQYATTEQKEQALNNYFDAFRTMKAVHFLRDKAFPNVPFAQVINAPYLRPLADYTNNTEAMLTDKATVQSHLKFLQSLVWNSGN